MLVPHYTLAPYFLAILAWRIYVSFWWPPAQYYYEISRYSEVIELILAAAFFLFMVFQLRKNKKYG
jgi:exosortase/archaeosortase